MKIITIEDGDGILHEMTVESVNQDDRTITGKIVVFPNGKEGAPETRTVTVRDIDVR